MPFTLAVDTREQLPFTFTGIQSNADTQYYPYLIPTTRVALPAGDYSIVGLESDVTVERKSLEDLFNSLSSGRKNEEAKHVRMSEYAFAAFVIEADWDTIFSHPPPASRLDPKIVYRTAISWSIRYGVHWWACPGKRFAEITTFRLLKGFWESVNS